MTGLIQKIKNSAVYIKVIIVIVIAGGIGLYINYQHKENTTFATHIFSLERSLQSVTNSLQETSSLSKNTASQIKEIADEKAAAVESQSERMTTVIAKVAPTVVSVVISKDVPQLKIDYESLFEDNSIFKDLGIKIPVYTQAGTTTKEIGAGTGFFIRSDGYILTNKHVAGDLQAKYTILLSSGVKKKAVIFYQDTNKDIAILKIEGSNYPVVDLGDSSLLQLGETVAVVGNALGEYTNSVSVGVISGINRSVEASDEDGNIEKLNGVLQTDAAINPGNSGGPLVNLSGKIIGINVASITGSNNIGFSIPINEVKKIIGKVVK